MASIHTILTHLNQLLDTPPRKDYGPNGLQVAGKSEIKKIVTGVTASLQCIDAAVSAGGDMLLVHHGILWGDKDLTITGAMHKRLKALLLADVNLVAYHLPLDFHAEFGNNVLLGQLLEITPLPSCPLTHDLTFGELPMPLTGAALAERIENKLGRKPLWLSGGERPIRKLAWITGGAPSFFEAAARAGVDAFITGESKLNVYDLAREYGVHFYAAGHHATERLGVKALGDHLAANFGLVHEYVELDNPI